MTRDVCDVARRYVHYAKNEFAKVYCCVWRTSLRNSPQKETPVNSVFLRPCPRRLALTPRFTLVIIEIPLSSTLLYIYMYIYMDAVCTSTPLLHLSVVPAPFYVSLAFQPLALELFFILLRGLFLRKKHLCVRLALSPGFSLFLYFSSRHFCSFLRYSTS